MEPSPPSPAEALARTSEFKEWFGNSRTVDAEGRPVVFYRGESSGSTHEAFDRKKTREGGFFFTTDLATATIYANKGEPRAFYLRAERYLDLTEDGMDAWKFISAWGAKHDLEDFRDRESGEIVDPITAVQGGRLFDWEGDWSSRLWRDLQSHVEYAGYDAVTLPDWDNGRGMIPATVVFRPENVRLIKPPALEPTESPARDIPRVPLLSAQEKAGGLASRSR
jgi:hypothetical protein